KTTCCGGALEPQSTAPNESALGLKETIPPEPVPVSTIAGGIGAQSTSVVANERCPVNAAVLEPGANVAFTWLELAAPTTAFAAARKCLSSSESVTEAGRLPVLTICRLALVLDPIGTSPKSREPDANARIAPAADSCRSTVCGRSPGMVVVM